MHARHVVEPPLEERNDARDARERPEPRAVSADDRILPYETLSTFDIRQHDAHVRTSATWKHLTRRPSRNERRSGRRGVKVNVRKREERE